VKNPKRLLEFAVHALLLTLVGFLLARVLLLK
jgi:hypothetical protein